MTLNRETKRIRLGGSLFNASYFNFLSFASLALDRHSVPFESALTGGQHFENFFLWFKATTSAELGAFLDTSSGLGIARVCGALASQDPLVPKRV